MIPHFIQVDTAEHTDITHISTTEVKDVSTRRKYTKRKQTLQTKWEGTARIKIGSKDFDESEKGRKSQKRLISLTI